MRKLNVILRGLLGGAAVATFVACEEVEPPKPVKQEVHAVQPAAPPKVVEEPKQEAPKLVEEAKKEEPKTPPTVEDESEMKPRKLIDGARDAISTGELQRAMKLAKLAVQKAPARSSAWNTLGRAQLKSGDKKGAIESFEKAIELDPDNVWAENNLGLALVYDGRYDEAVDALESATEGDHVEGYMWNNLGMAYEHLDRLEEARAAYQKAAELKAPLASKNLARLQGVKSIRTAKADVKSDVVVSDKPMDAPIDLGTEVDGGPH